MEWEIFSHIYHWSQTSRSRSRNVLTRFLSIRINWLKYLKPDMTSLQQLWQLISLYMTLYDVIVYIIISLSVFELWDPYFKKIIQPSKKQKTNQFTADIKFVPNLNGNCGKCAKYFFLVFFENWKTFQKILNLHFNKLPKYSLRILKKEMKNTSTSIKTNMWK